MDNEGKLNSSMIVLDVGAYMSFNADNGEIGFGTREIVSEKRVYVHQYKDYFARKYRNESRTEYYGGEWVHGKYEGQGTRVSAKYKYMGEWLAGKMNGHGRHEWTTGEVYTGSFQNGALHGNGTMQYSNSRQNHVFEGEWNGGQRWTGIYTDKTKPCTKMYETGKIIENSCT